LTTPCSIQVVARAGRRSPDQGAAGTRGSKGSVRTVTDSANSFSPTRLPPPGFEKKLRPSSALRAARAPGRKATSSSTACGSRITV
jgi:hypothetical protein